jgi:hypothetical protein
MSDFRRSLLARLEAGLERGLKFNFTRLPSCLEGAGAFS